MDKQNIDSYLSANGKYFAPSAIPVIRQKLERANNDALVSLQSCNLKDPTTILIVSIFLGGLGIDRFMIGDTGMGVLKLLTAGGCGTLAIIDWFTISKKVKEKNLATISMFL